MDHWFSHLAAGGQLSDASARQLHNHGFVVLPGPIGEIDRLGLDYDAAVTSADAADVKTGKTTTRVVDFVNRGSRFSDLYVFPPLLEACCRIIGRPFKLSSMHARTLRRCASAQDLHVDVQWGSPDWPLVGFILMVDEFRPNNGATRFVPGSHRSSGAPEQFKPNDPQADCLGQVLACGAAGSLIIFNGSTWHGYSANTSGKPRRSLQGAFIPCEGHAGTDFASRMCADTHVRLSPLARYLLQV
jgi:hypothetical protein